MDGELRRARELTKQNKKQQALMALKKKKMYESQVGVADWLVSWALEGIGLGSYEPLPSCS